MFVWHVVDGQHSKIRQPRFRTDGSKLWIVDHNLVSRKLVGPGLNLWKLRVETGGRMFRGITGRSSHVTIVAFAQNAAEAVPPASNQYRAWRVLLYLSRLGNGKLLLTVVPAAT